MDKILPKQPSSYSRLMRQSLLIYNKISYHSFFLAFIIALFAFSPWVVSELTGRDIFFRGTTLDHLWVILLGFISSIFFIALIWDVYCILIEKAQNLWNDLLFGGRKFLEVLLTSLLVTLIIYSVYLISFGIEYLILGNGLITSNNTWILLIVTFIIIAQFIGLMYFSSLFAFSIPILVTQKKGIFAAIEHSTELVWGHWWMIFRVQSTPWLLYILLMLYLKIIFRLDLHIFHIEHIPKLPWSTILHILILTAFIPWGAALLLLQLHDLELRQKREIKANT